MGSFVWAARFKSVIEMVKTALVVLVLFAGSISAKSECSNRCDNGGWCGERRKNTTTGAVQRCADRTRYGKSCASTCGKGDNDYHWCWVGWHLEDDWEYCAPVGQTRYGRLVLETALRGGRITGGATRTKKKKSGNTAPHLERFWTQLILSTARTVLGNVELKGRNTGGSTSLQSS